MFVDIFHYFNYYVPDFVMAICLVFIFGFSFGDICLNPTKYQNKPPVESPFLARDQAPSLWSGSPDSKTLDYQKTPNPWEFQRARTPTPLVHKTWHHPTTSSTLCRVPHPNSKQTKIKIQSLADRIATSLSTPHQWENLAHISPHMEFTQIAEPTL